MLNKLVDNASGNKMSKEQFEIEHAIVKGILDICFTTRSKLVKVRKNSNRSEGCCHHRKIIVMQQIKN